MDPQTPPPHAARAGLGLVAALGVFLLALLFGAWGLWRGAQGGQPPPCDAATTNELAQRATTLARSDQVSRDANTRLQSLLTERDEQIAQLKADVDFYERLVGATGQRHGLSVHALRMQRQPGGAWHFTAVLTQNLDRGGVTRGELSLAVEGSQAGALKTLDWDALRQQPRATGAAFSFRYFEEIAGDVFLPAGFTPVRIVVRLRPAGGGAIEHSVPWAEAAAAAP